MKFVCVVLLVQDKCLELLYVIVVTAKVLAFCYQSGSISCFTNTLADLCVKHRNNIYEQICYYNTYLHFACCLMPHN